MNLTKKQMFFVLGHECGYKYDVSMTLNFDLKFKYFFYFIMQLVLHRTFFLS